MVLSVPCQQDQCLLGCHFGCVFVHNNRICVVDFIRLYKDSLFPISSYSSAYIISIPLKLYIKVKKLVEVYGPAHI